MVSFNILVLFLDYYRLDLQWTSNRMSDMYWFMITEEFWFTFSMVKKGV